MREDQLREILQRLKDDEISVDDVIHGFRRMPFEDLEFAKIDHHRGLRCGAPEVIFCEGKTPEQVGRIAERIWENGSDLLATRANSEHYEAVRPVCPKARYEEDARCIVACREELPEAGMVAVVTAGTSDLPVAREAVITARALGSRTELITDVGVAGIYRLFGHVEKLQRANVVVVVAGMEGALAGVVGGLVARPVIGVPTSIGYGASFGGLSPLLTMLNSCAAGVSVVNIDNGFGAGYIAALINNLAAENDGDE